MQSGVGGTAAGRGLATPLVSSLIAQALVVFAGLTPPVLAVPAARAYGIAVGDIGIFTAALFITGMISAAAGGGLVLRLGAVRVMQVCLLSAGLGIALCATGSLPLAALGALLVGIGYGPMTPASSHLLAPITSDRWRPFVFSVKQTSVPLGGVVAGILLPVYVDWTDWRGAALIACGMALAGAAGLQVLRKAYDADRDPSAPLRISVIRPVRTVVRNRRLRNLAIVSFQFSSVQICVSAFFVAFLSDGLGYDLAQAGFALAVAQGAGIGGRIVWGAVASHTIGSRRMLAILALIGGVSGLATLAIGEGWPFAAIVLLGAILGASAVGWNGLFLSEIVAVTSVRESAAATGGALFFTFGGAMIAPAAFSGIVAVTGSYAVGFAAVGAFLLPAALLLLLPERAG